MNPVLALALVLVPVAIFAGALLLRWDGHARLRRDLVLQLRDDELRELSDEASAAVMGEESERLSMVIRAIHEAASDMRNSDLQRELAAWPLLFEGVRIEGEPRGAVPFEVVLWLRKTVRLAQARSRDATVVAHAKGTRVELAYDEVAATTPDATQRVWLGADRAIDAHLTVGRRLGLSILESRGRLVVGLSAALVLADRGAYHRA